MAYDEGEAELMRAALEGLPPGAVSEKKMFGGLCFLLEGNMIGGVSGKGGALMRVGKGAEAEACALPGVTPMVHGGRRMGGFVAVSAEAWGDDGLRERLVGWGVAHAASLPPK